MQNVIFLGERLNHIAHVTVSVCLVFYGKVVIDAMQGSCLFLGQTAEREAKMMRMA